MSTARFSARFTFPAEADGRVDEPDVRECLREIAGLAALPPSVSNLPVPMLHVCAAAMVMAQLSVKSAVADDISMPMPETPNSVSVLPALIVTRPPGLVI